MSKTCQIVFGEVGTDRSDTYMSAPRHTSGRSPLLYVHWQCSCSPGIWAVYEKIAIINESYVSLVFCRFILIALRQLISSTTFSYARSSAMPEMILLFIRA